MNNDSYNYYGTNTSDPSAPNPTPNYFASISNEDSTSSSAYSNPYQETTKPLYNFNQSTDKDTIKSYNLPRPPVDPDATGPVDLAKYPEPKDSTKKIRGKSDLLEMFFAGPINRELLIAKAFYFFFFSAFGSLLPLMAIYFKNMGMTPGQAGVLIGIRPFVEYLSAPFWADLAERFRKGKLLLLCSLAAWIVFNVPLGFIHPPPASCLVYNNSEFYIQIPSSSNNRMAKRSASVDDYNLPPWTAATQAYEGEDDLELANYDEIVLSDENSNELLQQLQDATTQTTPLILQDEDLPDNWKQILRLEDVRDIPLDEKTFVRLKRHTSPMKPTHFVGKSPYPVDFAENYDPSIHGNLVSPTFSFTIFKLEDIRKVFFLFLLLIVVGEFFCCPSLALADSAVLTLLGKDKADQYGRQRMFASVGWGLTMFIICLILDHSHSFSDHPCQVHEKERNYTPCYTAFTILMLCAMGVATRLPFDYSMQGSQSTASLQHGTTSPNPFQPQGKNPPPVVVPIPGAAANGKSKEVMADVLKNLLGKSKVFAQNTKKIPEWMPVLKHFANLRCGAFMFVAWFMGFGIGLIFTFLFWHLQDYGGTSTVFGVASVVNHISEMLAYFLSFPLIRQIGHIKVLCLGLVGNILRFLYISWITGPWWVMPFELIQGITHSAVWAAACSYIAHNTPQELRASAQGVLQFIHHGLGRACGTIFGGMLATAYGTTAVLRGYGFACIIVLAAFLIITYYKREQGFVSDLPQTDDPHHVAEEMAHLAPHGVPANPTIPRTPSNAYLMGNNGTTSPTTYSVNNGALNIPNAAGTNPFVDGSTGYGADQYHPTTDSYGGITISAGTGGVAYAAHQSNIDARYDDYVRGSSGHSTNYKSNY